MCLKVSKNARAKTAKKDIICYKQLREYKNKGGFVVFESPYWHFKYDLGKLYTLGGALKKEGAEVNEGHHSYVNREDVGEIPFECIIPKGAKYYTGDYDAPSYASNQIIIKERIRIVSERDAEGVREVMNVFQPGHLDIMKKSLDCTTEKKFAKHLKGMANGKLSDEVLLVRMVCLNNPEAKTMTTFIEWCGKNAQYIINT